MRNSESFLKKKKRKEKRLPLMRMRAAIVELRKVMASQLDNLNGLTRTGSRQEVGASIHCAASCIAVSMALRRKMRRFAAAHHGRKK